MTPDELKAWCLEMPTAEETFPFNPEASGYHLNKRHWVTITVNREVADGLVRELIQDSYDLVKSRPRRRG